MNTWQSRSVDMRRTPQHARRRAGRIGALAGLGGALLASTASASFTGITWTAEDVDIAGFGPAHVVRLYASFSFDDPGGKLNVVFGNEPFPLGIHTDDGSDFYQNVLVGGDSADQQIPGIIELFPELAYDSFLDIGRTTSSQGGHVGFAPGFPPMGWGTGGAGLATTSHSWHRVPTDPLAAAGPDGRVFFAQITIARGRSLEGVVNLTLVENGQSSTLFGIEFSAAPPICAGDTNDDGAVDVNDLNNVILDWGTDGSANGGDLAGPEPGSPPDGIVDVHDLNAVIVNWGACP